MAEIPFGFLEHREEATASARRHFEVNEALCAEY